MWYSAKWRGQRGVIWIGDNTWVSRCRIMNKGGGIFQWVLKPCTSPSPPGSQFQFGLTDTDVFVWRKKGTWDTHRARTDGSAGTKIPSICKSDRWIIMFGIFQNPRALWFGHLNTEYYLTHGKIACTCDHVIMWNRTCDVKGRRPASCERDTWRWTNRAEGKLI